MLKPRKKKNNRIANTEIRFENIVMVHRNVFCYSGVEINSTMHVSFIVGQGQP